MPWQKLSDNPSTPLGNDDWQYVLLPPSAGVLRYGFRLLVPVAVPSSFNTAGYWGIYQGVAGLAVVSATHVIPLVGRGSSQALRVIGSGDADLVTEETESLYLVYFKHKWLPLSNLELYGLFPV